MVRQQIDKESWSRSTDFDPLNSRNLNSTSPLASASNMPPIHVGIVGLSASSKGVGWAASAHFPYLQASTKYELVALCNSSKSSAENAIAHFKLPASTRAYGSPVEMAQDPEIDLAVCCTSVKHHYDTLLPFIEAGIDVYTEVPLAINVEKTRELVALAHKKGVKTMIGMQGQANPAVNTIKRMIDDGKIGRVLSTTFLGYAGAFTGDPLPSSKVHLFDRAAGANMMTVWFLHSMPSLPRISALIVRADVYMCKAFNFIIHVLGEVSSFHSILDIVHPKIDIFKDGDPDRTIIKTLHSDTPDQILIQGKFESEALLSFHMEGGEDLIFRSQQKGYG